MIQTLIARAISQALREPVSLPINCLIQARVPGRAHPISQPDMKPRRITSVLDVARLEDGFEVDLIDADGQPQPHRLTFRFEPPPSIADFFDQFNPRYLAHTLERVADPEQPNVLLADAVRRAVLENAKRVLQAPTASLALATWLKQQITVPSDAGEPAPLTAVTYEISGPDDLYQLPATEDCAPERLAALETQRQRSARDNGDHHPKTRALDRQIQERVWAYTLAETTIREVVATYRRTTATPTEAGLLDTLTAAHRAVATRFDTNMITALAAQQRLERPLREIAVLFSELQTAPADPAAPVNVFWVNAPFFATDDEPYIACGDAPDDDNPLFFKGSEPGGLSTARFDDIEVLNEHIALLVVTDRARGGRDEAYLTQVAESLSVIVLSNVVCPALAGTAAAHPAEVQAALTDAFGHSPSPGAHRVALFATDLFARPAYAPFETTSLSLGPVTAAAGHFLAVGLEREPASAHHPIQACLGIPTVLRNQARVRAALPVSTVVEISGLDLRPCFHFHAFQSVARTSIAHAAILDTIRRYVTFYLLNQGRAPATERQLQRTQADLNKKLARLLTPKSLLRTAEVVPDACRAARDATGRWTQYYELRLAFHESTDVYHVTLKVAA